MPTADLPPLPSEVEAALSKDRLTVADVAVLYRHLDTTPLCLSWPSAAHRPGVQGLLGGLRHGAARGPAHGPQLVSRLELAVLTAFMFALALWALQPLCWADPVPTATNLYQLHGE